MRSPTILFPVAISIVMAGPAAGGDCPAAGRDGRLAYLAAAPSCQQAALRFKRCAIGARLDGELALRVEEVCGKAFLSRLRGEDRAGDEAAIDACNAPNAKKLGGIYRSIAAHCRVGVMAKYANGH